MSWVAATRSPTFAAAVSYYGGGVPDLAAERPNCPVQLHSASRTMPFRSMASRS